MSNNLANHSNATDDTLSAFGFANDALYKEWKESKLQDYPHSLSELIVDIKDPENLSPSEHKKILKLIKKTNFALFQCEAPGQVSKSSLTKFAAQFGLEQLDGNLCSDEDDVSSITVDTSGRKNTYIPYTNRAISWHTDGYYNDVPGHAVRSFVLYCAQKASEGGTNRIMDHELAYIYLRDRDPMLALALFHDNAMTIPANVVNGEEIRAAQTGPVFLEDHDQSLSMRYTARTRSIEWREDDKTQKAVDALTELFQSDHPGIFEHTMQPGQGIISNNILHMRTAFTDAPDAEPRLYYRARYYQKINPQMTENLPC